MTNAEIRNLSRENVKKNGFIAIIVFFFMALISGSMVLLNLLFHGLYIIVIPLMVLPTCFAFQFALVALRESDTLSFSLVFTGFKRYFNQRFLGTYMVFKSLLWMLIIYVASLVTTSIVINLSFYVSNFMGFRDLINEILYEEMTTEALDYLISSNQTLFDIYMVGISLPPLVALSYGGLLFYTRNSVSFFLRLSDLKYPGVYLSQLHLTMIKGNRRKFYKTMFALNWPVLVLFTLGFALGGYIGYLYQFNYSTMFTFGLALAIFLSFGLYGFKYFANKEAIYVGYIYGYKDADSYLIDLKQKELERIKLQEEQYQQMMEDLERRMRELNKDSNDEDDNNDIDNSGER